MQSHLFPIGVLGLIGVILAGCTVGPDHVAPPLSAAVSWSSPQDQTARRESLANWWRRFDDPVLNSLIEDVSTGNTDVAQAVARLRQARESATQTGAALLPSIDSSVSATRSRSFLGRASSPASSSGTSYYTTNSFDAGFDASYELDIFGGKRRDVERATASAVANEADLADTLLSSQGDVASYYVELRGYQARLALARRMVSLRQDSLALARAKARAGTGAELDAVQAQAELESARADIPPLEQSTREAELRLAVLTGQTPAAMQERLAALRPVPSLAGRVSPEPPVTALARRPDIRAAERRIAAATANIGVAEADRLPAVSLAGSIGLNGSRLSNTGHLSSNVWSFGPTIDLPIFDAGRRASVVRERVAARDESIATWRGIVNTAVEDVEKALSALDRERAHEAALRRTVAAYSDSASLALIVYSAGRGDYTDVVTAQRSLASAQDSLVQSQVSLAKNAVALFKALGGGWGEDLQAAP
ncbi:efflux transporter outer membrane subunit [Roseomonas sp. GC11]|uniref:efflux transporter outer membrane subunit n=1 Tax=Roseomonas sp. GC11 TaxID=2950546 RepID=UPI00210E72EB|nr:efflux transporter outer membrane subunit [Roseomonas sp. GC11]MCQ4161001.1 efflux transporter outer membrane subunit [Roseomonas sp. GC11]